jgi:hypothetical protein
MPLDWTVFLEDFQRHWPTDDPIYVDFVRDGLDGNAAARSGHRRWRRLTEARAGAKSVFHFDVPARWRNRPTRVCRGRSVFDGRRGPNSFLAIRRMGNPERTIGGGGSLAIPLEQGLCAPGPDSR